MNVEEYWHNFKRENKLPSDLKYFEAFSFGDSKELSDKLLALVLTDKKVATTSLYLEDEEYPKVGDYSIVLDGKGEPACVIQTIAYRILPLKAMTYDLCRLEGEDESLATWLDTHVRVLKKDLAEYGYHFSFEQAIFFEIFTRVK